MTNLTRQLSESHDVSAKVAQMLQTRTRLALGRFSERAQQAREQAAELTTNPTSLPELWAGGARYGVDFAQRSILFWDTLRQRGNNFLEHERQGLPPVLRFDYEMVMDGRSFKRPVNYALLRIVPPKGVTVDAQTPALRDHRSARRSRSGHRRLQGRFASRGRVARRASRVLRHLLPESRTGTNTAGRVRRRARVRAPRARASSGCPEAGNRRQLSGRLGSDDAGRCQSRRHRSDRDRRRADVLLGRRLERGRRRQSDALCRGAARRHLARLALLRSRRGQVRRRLAGAELREPESGQHVLGQVLPGVRQRRHRDGALSRVRALVGWLLPAESRRDRVDHAESLRRQQAVVGHGEGRRRAGCSTCARSRSRSSCSPRWATTSRRRSRPSTGSPTCTAAPRRSRPAGR